MKKPDEHRRGGLPLPFICNICGKISVRKLRDFPRDWTSCRCGSYVRYRAIIHVLSTRLFDKSLPIPQWPTRKDIKGVGMSDWEGYATKLPQHLDYQNTFYHKEPRLDITNIKPTQSNSLDFLISSEVLEHVPPPVVVAFENAFKILRPGGLLLLTVPFSLESQTREHFPDWHDTHLESEGDERVLHNRTVDGRKQTYRDLVFHGGEGFTLELRLFALPDILRYLRRAGFTDIQVLSKDVYRWGIVNQNMCSLPISAIKPR